jgi:hypothetical protein
MKNHNHERFAEELLDTALAHYRGVEPRWGLEERILTNLRERARSRPWARTREWIKFGPALAAMVTIAIMSQIALRPISDNAVLLPPAHETDLAQKRVTAIETAQSLPSSAKSLRPAPAKLVAHRPARKLSHNSEPLPVQPAALHADNDVQITDIHVSDLQMAEIAISGSGRDD